MTVVYGASSGEVRWSRGAIDARRDGFETSRRRAEHYFFSATEDFSHFTEGFADSDVASGLVTRYTRTM